MSTIIKIDADTTVEDLHGLIGQNYGACCDLIALGASEHGERTVQLGKDDDGGHIDVLYFPTSDRAAIDDNGSTHWTDASSVEDAIRRYRNDELAN